MEPGQGHKTRHLAGLDNHKNYGMSLSAAPTQAKKYFILGAWQRSLAMEPRLEALATCIIPFWLYHAFLPSPSNPALVTFFQALALFLAANVLVLVRMSQ